jgi:hypothetical protein
MEQGAAALRQMRITQRLFLFTVFLIAYQAEQMAGIGTGYSSVFLGVIASVAVFDAFLAFYFRRKRLFPALEKLHLYANDTGALKEWRFSIILSLALTESIALYGFVLRILGASRRVSWPFFLASWILMLVWRPRLDLRGAASNTEVSQ